MAEREPDRWWHYWTWFDRLARWLTSQGHRRGRHVWYGYTVAGQPRAVCTFPGCTARQP